MSKNVIRILLLAGAAGVLVAAVRLFRHEKAAVDTTTQQIEDALSPDDMNDVVLQVYAEFDACSIRDFVPLLVEKRIRRQLAGPDR